MKRGVVAVAGVAVVALLAGVGWFAIRNDVVPFLAPDQCTAEVGDHTVVLEPSQARYAGLITAIAVQRGMPARAASIALAAAYQESNLRNLDGGDRDSAGLFQQRPSQGWGTLDEVRDPVYATNAFYDALTKVDGYEQLEITVAAQEVQRSGFPDAYADHEADARALASALTGNSPEGFSCRLGDSDDGVDGAGGVRADRPRGRRTPRPPRAVPRPAARRLRARRASRPGTWRARRTTRAARSTLFVRPVSAANKTRGWAIAQYLVSQADRLGDQDRDLRRPDLDLRPPVRRRLARLRPARALRRPGDPRAPRPRARRRLLT